MRTLTLATGFGLGYVLGTKAGQQRYEALRRTARVVAENPAVQQAAGVVGARAAALLDDARKAATARVKERLGGSPVVSPAERRG